MIATIENKKIIPARLEGEFQTLLGKTFASEPDWLKKARQQAFSAFLEQGVPSRRHEEYKYTDVRKVFAGNFSCIHNEAHTFTPDLGKLSIDRDSIKLIFVNGWLYKESTLDAPLPEGVVIGSMANEGLLVRNDLLRNYLGRSLDKNNDPFVLLNTALWFDGAFIYLPAGSRPERTIEIIHICTGGTELLASPRHLIIAEEGAEARIIEHSVSAELEKKVIINSVAEVFVHENARLNYYKIQNENRNAFHLHTTSAVQKRDSHFDTNTVTLGCDWVRNNLNISLEGENCDTHLNGLFIAADNQHTDNHTRVYHGQPHCQSNQLYKGILGERSTGVFNGKIYVERDAQKTNAYQSSKNILLSDDATINTKPELEIYADDVKCSHGSSTGKIDEDALFYLRSRGLGEESARKLLLQAFAADVLDTIRIDSLKNYLEALVTQKLSF
ncbi:MAG: Fe-S cluster assembly protein SufD [Bacteroidota bacterium]